MELESLYVSFVDLLTTTTVLLGRETRRGAKAMGERYCASQDGGREAEGDRGYG